MHDPYYWNRNNAVNPRIRKARKEHLEVVITSKSPHELATRKAEKLREGYTLLNEGKSIDGGGYTVYFAALRRNST